MLRPVLLIFIHEGQRLEGAHAIEEQHAIEMIGLVLDHPGRQTLGDETQAMPFPIQSFDADFVGNGGKRVEPHIVRGWWKDTGRLEDMLEANRLVLEDVTERLDGELIDTKVEGKVVIEKGAKLERSTVRGPAIIGAGAHITDSYVGPYTAIDVDVVIAGSEIEHSIVLAGSSIRDLPARMEASLLGKGVSVERSMGMPKTLRFLVGDNANIAIP
jgi:glucose-1-phosphate thymidylyltransferase